ncbi:MarR family winged helix-turn-helix transcriptional regulator [Piscinibacter sp.]|uniref:MarR family winged helix-turn-helix transcriptional regulator n=1 Tax=Piscinibacter sp. TaxID=1903157 RepID=UPI0039E29CDA
MPRTAKTSPGRAKAGKPAAKGAAAAAPAAARPLEENWDQRLGFLMHDVSRLRRTVFDDFMKPLNVTRSQWWVLAYLSRHDGMIQSDLANVLELGKAALGSLVDRLEAAGLVRRGADESDRRAKRVYLSPAGAQLIKEMRVLSHEMSERILEGLDTDARHTLAALLGQVKSNLLAISKGKG